MTQIFLILYLYYYWSSGVKSNSISKCLDLVRGLSISSHQFASYGYLFQSMLLVQRYTQVNKLHKTNRKQFPALWVLIVPFSAQFFTPGNQLNVLLSILSHLSGPSSSQQEKYFWKTHKYSKVLYKTQWKETRWSGQKKNSLYILMLEMYLMPVEVW